MCASWVNVPSVKVALLDAVTPLSNSRAFRTCAVCRNRSRCASLRGAAVGGGADRLLTCDRRRSQQEQDERQGGGWMHPHLPGANASLIPALSANSMNRVTSPFRSVKIITQSVSNDRPVGFARPT